MKRTITLSIIIIVLAAILAACQPITIIIGQSTPTATQEAVGPTQPTDTEPNPVPTETTAPTSEPSPSLAPATGSIQGNLGYPSEVIPELRIVAFLYGTDTFYTLDTEFNQTCYQLDGLPEGNYHVVAYTRGGESFPAGLAGGFTQAVVCGMHEGCTDHSMVDVTVTAGHVAEGVHLTDWLVPLPPMTQPGQPVQGAITGKLSFPSESIPALRVVAFRLGDNQTFFVDTQMYQSMYELALPAGTYHVVAYMGGVEADASSIAGGYSQMVPCGLSVDCSDHTLIDVIVQQGSLTYGIDPADFYAQDGTFPSLP
jgi:hypothetical protein